MICTLEPVKKKGDPNKDSPIKSSADHGYNSHMSVLPHAGEKTGEMDGSDIYETTKRSSYGDDVEIPYQTIADCGKHLEFYERNRLKVGIIIHTTQTTHKALSALANPASNCKVTALAVLQPPPSFSMGDLLEEDPSYLTPGTIMRRWMRNNNLGNHSEPVAVLGGEQGAKEIVKRDDVDAVFIIVPDEIHQKYALSALENRKHVLLNDPVSVSLQAFNEQIKYARKYNKFVQSSTAFAHQFRVRQFMECVLREEVFGRVDSMHARLSLCGHDLPLVGIQQNEASLSENQGCIRRLGRYCVLISILIFTKLGSVPISAQCHRASLDKASMAAAKKKEEEDGDDKDNKNKKTLSGEPTDAECTVKYSDGRTLTFHVDYSDASATRQKLEVKAGKNMATMSDFVFPHPDGLATYRVYEDDKKVGVSNEIEVMKGEAIDIAGGPSFDVVMWRNFAELAKSIDEDGWDNASSPYNERVRELSDLSLHTKTILNALMKSLEEGFIEVPLAQQ